jgi:hypothetical protein
MAMDPNHALRTHERLFTGNNPHPDEELRKAAFNAIPRCASCGEMVEFKPNGATVHYNGAYDKDLGWQDKQDAQRYAGNLDADHTPAAEKPVVASHKIEKPQPASEVGRETDDEGTTVITKKVRGVEQIATRGNTATRLKRAVATRAANRQAIAINDNINLGRQFRPEAFDANGIAKSPYEIAQERKAAEEAAKKASQQTGFSAGSEGR